MHLPYYCFPRYMYPVMNFMIMIDAYVIGIWWDNRKNNKITTEETNV